MKYLFYILTTLLSINLSSQSSNSELQEKLNEILSIPTNNMSARDSAWHYSYYVSNILVKMDSIEKAKYYFKLGLQADKEWVCYFTRLNIKQDNEESEFLSSRNVDPKNYFAFKFGKDFLDKTFDICEKCCLGGYYKPQIKVKNPNANKTFTEIEVNDQKYRKYKNVDWLKQNKLDSINRHKIDSIFNNTEFNFYNEKENNIVWLVIQHSTDCDWTNKWIERYLDVVYKDKTKAGFISQTIERMYHPDNGYCTTKNPDETKEFLGIIKHKYGEDFARKIGYLDY